MIFRIFNRTLAGCHHHICLFFFTLFRTLLRLHNLRAVIFILLLLLAACEIGIAYLWTARIADGLHGYDIESVLFFFVYITSTAILLRIIEVRKNKSGERI